MNKIFKILTVVLVMAVGGMVVPTKVYAVEKTPNKRIIVPANGWSRFYKGEPNNLEFYYSLKGRIIAIIGMYTEDGISSLIIKSGDFSGESDDMLTGFYIINKDITKLMAYENAVKAVNKVLLEMMERGEI